LGGFFERQANEVAQFDQLSFLLVLHSESLKGLG
jgi:hypothetical protein